MDSFYSPSFFGSTISFFCAWAVNPKAVPIATIYEAPVNIRGATVKPIVGKLNTTYEAETTPTAIFLSFAHPFGVGLVRFLIKFFILF
jgi:hypothetical protein